MFIGHYDHNKEIGMVSIHPQSPRQLLPVSPLPQEPQHVSVT